MQKKEAVVKLAFDEYAANSDYNTLHFMIDRMIHDINIAEVVKVLKVDGCGPGATAGFVDVLPLVCRLDNWDRTHRPATIFHIPYSRIQGGSAALIIDPQPGDIGIAVFSKMDCSIVTNYPEMAKKDPVQPGSFRTFNKADGFYIGGFRNQAPETWLELTQTGNIVLHALENLTIETTKCVIQAKESVVVDSPKTLFTGDVGVVGNLYTLGDMNSLGNVQSGEVQLAAHVHDRVEAGNDTSGEPVRPELPEDVATGTDKLIWCLPEIAEAESKRTERWAPRDIKGWEHLKQLMLKWLQEPVRHYPDIDPEPYKVDWTWLMEFDRAKTAYDDLVAHGKGEEHPYNIYNRKAKEQIAEYVKRDITPDDNGNYSGTFDYTVLPEAAQGNPKKLIEWCMVKS